MHEVLVNRLGGLSLPRKSVVKLTDRHHMTLDVYRGRKTAMQQQQQQFSSTCSLVIELLMVRTRFALILYFCMDKAACHNQMLFLNQLRHSTYSADVGGTFHTGF